MPEDKSIDQALAKQIGLGRKPAPPRPKTKAKRRRKTAA
jgi:hypothetical protein